MTVIDCVGREIKPGCSIVYPVRRGSEMKLKRMRVQQVTPKISGFNTDGRRVYVQNFENVVVIVPLGVQYETDTG